MPPTTDAEAAVEVINSVRAAANTFGTPADPANARKLKHLATFTNLLVESHSGGTLPTALKALDDALIRGDISAADLSSCISFGAGTVNFTNCLLGFGTTLAGSIAGSGNTFTLDITFTAATPFGIVTITMEGTVTVITSAITGTITLVTTTTKGANTSTITVTEEFDVGVAPICPTSGTVSVTYHVVEREGQNITRDDESGFTATYGPNCGDVSFDNQTTTTLPVTTTTIGGQTFSQEAAAHIIKNMHDIHDLATGDGLDADKLDDLSLMVDRAHFLAGRDADGHCRS